MGVDFFTCEVCGDSRHSDNVFHIRVCSNDQELRDDEYEQMRTCVDCMKEKFVEVVSPKVLEDFVFFARKDGKYFITNYGNIDHNCEEDGYIDEADEEAKKRVEGDVDLTFLPNANEETRNGWMGKLENIPTTASTLDELSEEAARQYIQWERLASSESMFLNFRGRNEYDNDSLIPVIFLAIHERAMVTVKLPRGFPLIPAWRTPEDDKKAIKAHILEMLTKAITDAGGQQSPIRGAVHRPEKDNEYDDHRARMKRMALAVWARCPIELFRNKAELLDYVKSIDGMGEFTRFMDVRYFTPKRNASFEEAQRLANRAVEIASALSGEKRKRDGKEEEAPKEKAGKT